MEVQDPATTAAVELLIRELKSSRFHDSWGAISQNLVHYCPRIRSRRQQKMLFDSLWTSPFLQSVSVDNITTWFEISEAIFTWKLDISEPQIKLADFFLFWDEALRKCQHWSVAHLALLSGALSTDGKFQEFQERYAVDGSDTVASRYVAWRFKIFMPLWTAAITKQPQSPAIIEQLALIFVGQYPGEDAKNIPCSLLSQILMDLCVRLLSGEISQHSFLSRHLSQVSHVLQVTLLSVPDTLISRILSQLCVATSNLATKELNDGENDYKSLFYTHLLLTVVSVLKATVVRAEPHIQVCRQVMFILFNLSFITESFGTVGFEEFELSYEVTTLGLLRDNLNLLSVTEVMRSNLRSNTQNEVSNARMVFLFTFLERVLPYAAYPKPYFDEYLLPLIFGFIASPQTRIAEAAHSACLALISNQTVPYIQTWKLHGCKSYLLVSLSQFRQGRLNSGQLTMISQTIASQFASITRVAKDFSRQILQTIYLAVLNCENDAMRPVLIECLIGQLPFVSHKYVWDWLDNCYELILKSRDHRVQLLDKLWQCILGSSDNTLLIEWWFRQGLPSSKL
ncbi:LAMI_0E15478g1_1 [Lachancea mirantina]|uniref:LAMI_0E15478g1_1 n=1 Tax=Lachancea mirantina TaxID=1230905 RepID=A0A1G4JSB6_9SACH|nr:LAMI_0E15478g1_1 [Lachancea mirantina]